MTDKREKLRSRLKDVLWGLRQRYPALASQVDKIIPFLAFKKPFTSRQLTDLFIEYPVRNPASYIIITTHHIHQAVYAYHRFITEEKGLYKTHQFIRTLEQILRLGFEAYDLVENEITGYEMKVK